MKEMFFCLREMFREDTDPTEQQIVFLLVLSLVESKIKKNAGLLREAQDLY